MTKENIVISRWGMYGYKADTHPISLFAERVIMMLSDISEWRYDITELQENIRLHNYDQVYINTELIYMHYERGAFCLIDALTLEGPDFYFSPAFLAKLLDQWHRVTIQPSHHIHMVLDPEQEEVHNNELLGARPRRSLIICKLPRSSP